MLNLDDDDRKNVFCLKSKTKERTRQSPLKTEYIMREYRASGLAPIINDDTQHKT